MTQDFYQQQQQQHQANPYAYSTTTASMMAGSGSAAGGYYQNAEQTTPMSTGKSKKSQQMNSLTHCTLKQLMEKCQQPQPESPFYLDGRELGQIVIVACIRQVTEQSTSVNYRLDDGTALMDCRYWVNPQNQASADSEVFGAGAPPALDKPQLRENMYVSAYGTLRSFGQKKYFQATHIRPLKDMNEITWHHLKCIAGARGLLSAPSGTGAGAPSQQQWGNPMNAQYQPSFAAGGGGAVPSEYYSSEYTNAAPSMTSGMGGNSFPDRLMEMIKTMGRGKPQGVSLQELHRQYTQQFPGPNVTMDSIKDTVESLTSDGHLYATLDDHVKSTME